MIASGYAEIDAMTLPLQGRTVALAEGRQLEELADMLESEGATVLRCPLVSILDAPDPAPWPCSLPAALRADGPTSC